MKVLFLILLFPLLVQAEIYQGEDVSLIQWDKLDHKEWLDYQLWKDQLLVKDQYPDWRRQLRERRLNELMGRVLECVGKCMVYRGEGYTQPVFRSSVREGDEVVTDEDSYLWIFLIDGTMVRLSPGSSVTFFEINISPERNFLHARINSGNVLWLSRDALALKEQTLRETDTLFIPLRFYEANAKEVEKSEEDLYSFVVSVEEQRSQKYQRLNKLIEENNKLITNKQTESFLVMPNGTIHGTGLRTEFVVLSGEKSFVKNRSFAYLGEDSGNLNDTATLFFRGYANTEEEELQNDVWYEISPDGRSFSELSQDDRQFGIGEYLTKRIPTILIARELLLKKYSSFVFDAEISAEKLAVESGYRQWQEKEIDQRVKFLKEHSRRIETTNLMVSNQLRRRLEKLDEEIHGMTYTRDVYKRAIHNYLVKQETSDLANSEQESLSSTRRRLWKKVNAGK